MQSHLSPSALLEKRAHPANGRLLTLGLLGAQGRGLSRGGRHGTKDARAVATSWQETNRFLARPSRRRGEANGKLHQTEPETSRQESQPPGFSPPATGQPHVDPKKKKKTRIKRKMTASHPNTSLLLITTYVGGAFRCEPENLLDKF